MGGWLAGLDAFVVGLAYLVALLTTRFVIRPLLVAILGAAPVIGGWLAANVDAGLSSFEAAITPAANASLGVVTGALGWLEQQARNLTGDLAQLADAALLGLWQLATVTLPHAIQQALAQAAAEARALLAVAEADLNSLSATLSTRLDAVAQILEGLIADARREAQQEVSAAESVVLAEVRKVEQAAGQLWQQAEYDAQQIGRRAEAVAEQLVAAERQFATAAVTTIRHDLGVLEQQATAQLPEWIRTVEKDLGALREQTAAQFPELERNLSQEIKDLEASAPWQLITGLEEEGKALLTQGMVELLQLERRALRTEIEGARALQAKLTPFVRAITAEVRARR